MDYKKKDAGNGKNGNYEKKRVNQKAVSTMDTVEYIGKRLLRGLENCLASIGETVECMVELPKNIRHNKKR